MSQAVLSQKKKYIVENIKIKSIQLFDRAKLSLYQCYVQLHTYVFWIYSFLMNHWTLNYKTNTSIAQMHSNSSSSSKPLPVITINPHQRQQRQQQNQLKTELSPSTTKKHLAHIATRPPFKKSIPSFIATTDNTKLNQPQQHQKLQSLTPQAKNYQQQPPSGENQLTIKEKRPSIFLLKSHVMSSWKKKKQQQQQDRLVQQYNKNGIETNKSQQQVQPIVVTTNYSKKHSFLRRLSSGSFSSASSISSGSSSSLATTSSSGTNDGIEQSPTSFSSPTKTNMFKSISLKLSQQKINNSGEISSSCDGGQQSKLSLVGLRRKTLNDINH